MLFLNKTKCKILHQARFLSTCHAGLSLHAPLEDWPPLQCWAAGEEHVKSDPREGKVKPGPQRQHSHTEACMCYPPPPLQSISFNFPLDTGWQKLQGFISVHHHPWRLSCCTIFCLSVSCERFHAFFIFLFWRKQIDWKMSYINVS